MEYSAEAWQAANCYAGPHDYYHDYQADWDEMNRWDGWDEYEHYYERLKKKRVIDKKYGIPYREYE